MSEIMNWEFKVLFSNNREKIIQLLISELIFLEECFKKARNKKERDIIKNTHKKIEEILIAQQKNVDNILSEKDYENLITRIYHLLNNIVERIN
jgi:hypothetical protein